ncbi:hypothetical protein D3C72_1739890 [compost metagenome]
MHACSAQQYLNARHQLRERKGLDHIVIGATLQATHPVFHIGSGGKHQNRGGFRLPQRGEHGKPVNTGQHAIQNDEVVFQLHRHVEAIHTIDCGIDRIAFLGEALAQVLPQLRFVFNQKQSHAADCLAFETKMQITNL